MAYVGHKADFGGSVICHTMASYPISRWSGIKVSVSTVSIGGFPRQFLCVNPIPKGPRTQIMGVLGPKYHNINGIWALNPYYLGPWTLRVYLKSTHMTSS